MINRIWELFAATFIELLLNKMLTIKKGGNKQK